MSTGRTALAGEGPSSSVPAPRHRLTVVPLAARSQHLHRALERPHGHLPLRLLSRGTSLETAEKHYGDARVDAVHLDELIREFELPTRNPPGCERRCATFKDKGTLCLLRGSNESGRPGSNRRRPPGEAFVAPVGQGFFGGGSRNRITQYGAAAARRVMAPTLRPPARSVRRLPDEVRA